GGDSLLPSATTAPSATGTARVGRTLTGTSGVWQNAVGLALQWQRDTGGGFTDIPGATATSYTLTAADLGASIRLPVTASNADGSTDAASAPLGPVADAITIMATPTAPPATTIGPPATTTRPTTLRGVTLAPRALRLTLRGTGGSVRVPLRLTPSTDGARYAV